MATKEGKYDPTTSDLDFSPKDLEETVSTIVKRVQHDALLRQPWMHKQAHYIRRRFCREFRGTEWPWPGASDIVIPTIDMQIERHKPLYIQSVLGVNPIATVLSMNPASMEKTHRVEAFLEWQFHHRDKNFPNECAYHVDYLLSHGHAIYRIDYDYRTRRVRDVILRDRLPDSVRVGSQMLQEMGAEQGALDTMLKSLGMSRAEIREAVPDEAIELAVRQHFRLDPEDPDDKIAIDKIVNWIRRSDEKALVVRMREVVADHPIVTAPPPERFIVPQWVTDIERAPRLCEEVYLHEDEVEQLARDQRWIANAADYVLDPETRKQQGRSAAPLESLPMDLARQTAHDDTSGGAWGLYSGPDDAPMRFWRIYCHLPVDKGKQPEKVRLTVHPETSTVMQAVVLPFADWPFVKFNFEHSDRPYYRTRGIPEKLNDLDVEKTTQHRQKLNAMTVTNSPTLLWRTQSLINPEMVRWIPGTIIPVSRADDVQELRMSSKDLSFEREEMLLDQMVERYMGTLDIAISQQGNLTRPRTAHEIQAVQGIQGQVVGPRLLLYQYGMMRVYRKVFNLHMRFGPTDAWVQVTGKPQPVHLTRGELEGEYDFIPTPASLSNPSTRVQEAKLVVDTMVAATQYPEILAVILQEWKLDFGEVLRNFLDEVNWRRAEVAMRRLTPEEKQQRQQAQLAAQQGPPPQDVNVSGPVGDVRQRIGQAAKQAKAGGSSVMNAVTG